MSESNSTGDNGNNNHEKIKIKVSHGSNRFDLTVPSQCTFGSISCSSKEKCLLFLGSLFLLIGISVNYKEKVRKYDIFIMEIKKHLMNLCMYIYMYGVGLMCLCFVITNTLNNRGRGVNYEFSFFAFPFRYVLSPS